MYLYTRTEKRYKPGASIILHNHYLEVLAIVSLFLKRPLEQQIGRTCYHFEMVGARCLWRVFIFTRKPVKLIHAGG